MDHTLDYQSRDRKINPRFSGLSDETFIIEVLSPNDLVVGGRLNPNSLTHFNEGSQHIFSVRNKKILFFSYLQYSLISGALVLLVGTSMQSDLQLSR